MGLFLVMAALLELVAAVVHGRHPPEAVLQRFVHFLVPLAVTDHLLLLGEVLAVAHGHGAVEVLPVVHVLACRKAALEAGAEPLEVPGVVCHLVLAGHHAHSLCGQDVGRQVRHACEQAGQACSSCAYL